MSQTNSIIDVSKKDIDYAIEENEPLIQQICQDVRRVYKAFNEISYYTKDSDYIDKRERKIENVIRKMAKEIVYLQTQLFILEQKTNTKIRKNISTENIQILESVCETMNALLDKIETQYIMIPYLQRIGVDTSYLTSKLSGIPSESDGDKNN